MLQILGRWSGSQAVRQSVIRAIGQSGSQAVRQLGSQGVIFINQSSVQNISTPKAQILSRMLLQNYPSEAKFPSRSQGQNARNLISNVLTFPLSGADSIKFQAKNFFIALKYFLV